MSFDFSPRSGQGNKAYGVSHRNKRATFQTRETGDRCFNSQIAVAVFDSLVNRFSPNLWLTP